MFGVVAVSRFGGSQFLPSLCYEHSCIARVLAARGVHCLYVVLFFVLFLVRCSPAPVLGVGLLLALEVELPLQASGPLEDPPSATMWRSSVEFTKHTTPSPGTGVERSGSDPARSSHSTAMAQSPALKAVLCDSSRWTKQSHEGGDERSQGSPAFI